MRATLAQLLATAMCFGLFIVTCPLTAPAAAAAPEPSDCCSIVEDVQHCAGAPIDDSEPERCCATHGCASVISIAAPWILAARIDAPRLALNFSQTIAEGAERPPVPPPRGTTR